jgi:hypothetical protein
LEITKTIIDINELSEYIKDITQKTIQGHMTWDKVNPTTYSWITTSPVPAKIMVQIIERPTGRSRSISTGKMVLVMDKSYLFQVYDETNKPVLSIASAEVDGAKELLERLYNSRDMSISRKGINLLKLIPK